MILDGYRAPWETTETDDLRAMVRRFMRKEALPHLDKWAQQRHTDVAFWRSAADVGLLCISIPEEFGGGGATFAHESIIMQEQAFIADDAWGNTIHSVICAHYIAAFGTEEQKHRWLPRLARGELIAALAMTEPGTGSDVQAVSTRARSQGEHYLLTGTKTFITNGTNANLIVTVARTGQDQGAKGLSLLVVETDELAGFERGRVLEKIGMHGQDTRELVFTDAPIPHANLLGRQEGQGFYQLMQQLPQERLAIAVTAAATCETAVRAAIDYAKAREAFGRRVMDFQNTKFVLAECATETLAVRSFVDHCTSLHLRNELSTEQASAAKYWATDMQGRIIDRCLQVFGGYGYMMEYPIARMYAAARVQRIYGGTNEIMKELISRGL